MNLTEADKMGAGPLSADISELMVDIETPEGKTLAIDDPVLIGRSLDALQRLCRTLRTQRRVCGRFTLAIRYSDHIEVTKHERIEPETCWECDLSQVVVSLFHKAMRRRIRLRALTPSMSGLTGYTEQRLLFEERTTDHRQRERAQKLAVALDTLKSRFGEQAIRYGRS